MGTLYATRIVMFRASLVRRAAFGRSPVLFAEAEAATQAEVSKDLKLNFYMPRETVYFQKVVHQVNIPGAAGDFGILANHVPTVAAMKPGVVSVFEDENTIKKYFVSGGFACIHPSNVADIAAVEAFPVDELDPEAVKSGVEEWTAKLASATEESEKQHAEVALDVHKAMEQALEDTSK